jgi:phosphoribosyl 1,2-cyclic phosphodiesterase
MATFAVKFWGVRGSIPTPGRETARYGGNTSCIEVRLDSNLLIFDCGTGIRLLGEALLNEKFNQRIDILVTHTHWDHIQGFPFFAPIFIPGSAIHVWGPFQDQKSFGAVMALQMSYSYFPVKSLELASGPVYHDIGEGQHDIGTANVKSLMFNHSVFNLGYRIDAEGKSMAYTGDHEPYYDIVYGESKDPENFREQEEIQRRVGEMNHRAVEFVRGVDLLIADAQYTDQEFEKKRGWGHSTFNQTVKLAIDAGVKRLVLFHHDPARSDRELMEIERTIRKSVQERGAKLKVYAAREGMQMEF